MSPNMRGRQRGMTVIGFLFLASLVGLVAYGGMKAVPLYMRNIQLSTVMDDVERELSGSGATPQAIRSEVSNRFNVEGIDLPDDAVDVASSSNGYTLRITHEQRTPYIASLWFLLEFDKQVEIRR